MTQLRWGGPLVLAMSFLLTSTTTNAVADEKAEQKALNAAIRKSLFDVTDSAVKTHNDGDVNGGYRLYQGGLIAVLPLLNHRPELQKYIKSGMNFADGQKTVEEASFKLRAVVDNVRSALEPGGALPEQKTLWVRLGGDKGVDKIVTDFVALSAKDPKVNFDRRGKYKLDDDTIAKVKKELVKQVSYLTDGPEKPEKDVKPTYKDWGITEDEFKAASANLAKALIMSNVQTDDAQDLLAAVFILRKDIVVPKMPMPAPPKTVWEALGGEKGVNQIVDDFAAAAIKDPMVNFDRNGKYKLDADTLAKVKKEIVKLISYSTEGPYKEEKGATPPWKGLGITDAEFIAATKHFRAALEKNGVSKDNVFQIQSVVGGMSNQIVEPKTPEPKKPDDKKPDDKKPDDKKPDDKPKDGEVSGTITVDGKPLESGKISFVGEDKKAIEGDVKDGKYKLTGVKPGMYRITVQAPDVVGAQYSTPFTTPLKGEIVKDKESISLELRGKK